MVNNAKKLVSVRLEADDLKIIDDWAKTERYRRRSDVVDAAINLAAWMIQNGHAPKLLYFDRRYDEVEEFKMEYRRKPW